MKPSVMIIILLFGLMTACQTKHTVVDVTNLNDLENIPSEEGTIPSAEPIPKPQPSESSIRLRAVGDAALTLGAQGGLAWASKQINVRIKEDKWHLDTIYNFNGMMLSHGVIPPILVQGDNSLNLADPNTIRIADRTYKIIAQARFATTPPNWREYLWMNYPEPTIPHRVLLPHTKLEREIWKKNVRLGWEKGVQQAFSIYRQDLARLKRDYQGMILYRKLLQARMVSPPFVSKTELGVTGTGEDMRVNDQVLRITELPQLQTDSKTWKAIVVQE